MVRDFLYFLYISSVSPNVTWGRESKIGWKVSRIIWMVPNVAFQSILVWDEVDICFIYLDTEVLYPKLNQSSKHASLNNKNKREVVFSSNDIFYDDYWVYHQLRGLSLCSLISQVWLWIRVQTKRNNKKAYLHSTLNASTVNYSPTQVIMNRLHLSTKIDNDYMFTFPNCHNRKIIVPELH